MTAAGLGAPFAALGAGRFHSGLAWITVGACVAACVPAGLRWLRVAQREHYLAGSVERFASRWWRSRAADTALAIVAVAAAVASVGWPVAGVVAAAAVALGPLGLSPWGRTSPLAWTRRLRTLAAVWAALEIVVVAIGVVTGVAAPLAVVAALIVPVAVDVACGLTAPVERRLSSRFVDAAAARLARVGPTVVGITGSFGKTSTKGHIAHLVRPTLTVVATPASFNNRAGLARAINEHLADGTEVFVAEMGTYGRGEIAELCAWCPPDIAVITAIGPVHLERFGSEDRIVEAKSEILEHAGDVVLPVDDPRLAALAERSTAQSKRVLRCSAVDRSADVCVLRSADGSRVTVLAHDEALAEDVELAAGIQATNLACAVAVALLLKVDAGAIGARLADLPPVEHRLQAVRAPSGVTILDDTYNSNPAGAAAALSTLKASTGAEAAGGPDRSGRLVVVTPGMVELGARQFDENRRFGAAMAAVATDALIVGRTNRRALLAGLASAPDSRTTVRLMSSRQKAVEWVREHLVEGDVVLYENDLPDHYP
ncbi:MAG TPA: UDP-N-acetylmuramoyl-tripeptide--D-alanyl-D-alanine ligase [Acidimicrobiales bacterium]|nr:UDP-N-acetylmuramoyl-tripeptide--D-alanyl-D-alanine ligase [Acidimicrobiales bacterium]